MCDDCLVQKTDMWRHFENIVIDYKKLKQEIESHFKKILEDENESKVPDITENAFGHSASGAIEDWTVEQLNKIDSNFKAYFPEEFLIELFTKIGKDVKKIETALQSSWWSCWLGTSKYVRNFISDKPLERSQQDGADILLFYGTDVLTDINSVILINAKSHNLEKNSRPPNIVSCKRLLEDFQCLLNPKHSDTWLPLANYWFVSCSWLFKDGNATIKEIDLRDLFKLDLVNSKGLTVNFDAAIQLQCHVKQMIELEQKKMQFMKNFSQLVSDQWKSFMKKRDKQYSDLTNTVFELISSSKKEF